MLNYYERIQKSIEYIESNLENIIDLDVVAQESFMSLSNFYRMFFAMVGYSVKEYIRCRRISIAALEVLDTNIHLIDIAVKYGFDSGDSFSRAFKRITGFLPTEFRKNNKIFNFERINLMEKYFNIQDKELLEKYPDIKVLKNLEPVRVAYYCYYGKCPETKAFAVMKDWIIKSGLKIDKQITRIFGYNNPSPSSPEQDEYGYEVCVTIGENIVINDSNVKVKVLEGGLYAVTGVKRDGNLGKEIMLTWKRFRSWLIDSKYTYGGHQWLEEHLGFDEDFNHIGGIDLYMPIIEKSTIDSYKTFETVAPMWTATFKATGKNAAKEAREYFLEWAKNEGLFSDNKKHRFFAYYNHEKIGSDDFFFKIHVSVDLDFQPKDQNIKLEEFKGGYYAIMKSKFKTNGWSWGQFIQWISKNDEFSIGNYWFFEEYILDKPTIEMDTDMVLHMPVRLKTEK